ncbi:MAG: MarR family transcriptional regulator [Ilumatobacteraceae bacterium]
MDTTTRDPIELAHRNWVASGWTEAADGMALVTSIMRVQQLFLADIEAILKPHGLTFSRFEVLRLLAFTREGVLPVGKIGERLQVHPASVTNAVQRLQDAGLVVRRANPDDGRGVLAEVTRAGRELVEDCTVLLNQRVFEHNPLTTDELTTARTALDSLRRSFGDPA